MRNVHNPYHCLILSQNFVLLRPWIRLPPAPRFFQWWATSTHLSNPSYSSLHFKQIGVRNIHNPCHSLIPSLILFYCDPEFVYLRFFQWLATSTHLSNPSYSSVYFKQIDVCNIYNWQDTTIQIWFHLKISFYCNFYRRKYAICSLSANFRGPEST